MADSLLWHLCPASAVPDILRSGLKPSIGPLARRCGEAKPAVYMFNSKVDAEEAVMNWYGDIFDEAYGESEPIALLRITLPPSGMQAFGIKRHGFESVAVRAIPPEYIAREGEL